MFPNRETFRFGVYEADTRTGELRKAGLRIKLQEKPFQLLVVLLENPGELVAREQLRQRLWSSDTYVEFDRSLNIAVGKLRGALNDTADVPRYVETLRGRGYRFIASVDSNHPASGPIPAPAAETTAIGSPFEVSGHAPLKGGATGDSSNLQVSVRLIKRRKKAAIGAVAVLVALAGLAWYLMRRPSRASAELTQTRLTFNSSENAVNFDAISPDGKYLAYSDPAGIRVKLLSTGEERLIPRPAGVPASAFWYLDSWFPDGTQLLADAYEVGGQKSMWTVSVLGQSPRELREGATGFEVSPDGTRIAFSPRGTSVDVREIWVMGSQGDNPQKVLALGENEWLHSVHWSPDGRRLAYIREQFAPENEASIQTCDPTGANRTVVVSDPNRTLKGFCWLPDGRMVYSGQAPPGSSDDNLWQIGIDTHTGAATGKALRLTQWAGTDLVGLSASRDGKQLVLRKETHQAQVYLGELAGGGTRMNPPRRLTNDEALDWPLAWMPDGKTVLFASNRNNTSGIFKQGISQDTAEPVVTGPQDLWFSKPSPDGAWILYVEYPKTTVGPSAPLRLMRIPVSGGVPQLVLESSKWDGHWCARAPGSVCVITEGSHDQRQLIITALDPLKGRGKVLRTIETDPTDHFAGRGLSPDGSTFAFSRGDEPEIHIRLLSLSAAADREITVKGWPNIAGLDWSADGKGFYCGSVGPLGSTLLYVDLKGNARVLWQYKGAHDWMWGVPSPDGRYLAIAGDANNSNVWMVEGF